MMPSSKRSRPKAPSAGSVYKDNLRGNAAPFTPAPVEGLDSSRIKKGAGHTAIPSTHSGQDETGTGKCQGA